MTKSESILKINYPNFLSLLTKPVNFSVKKFFVRQISSNDDSEETQESNDSFPRFNNTFLQMKYKYFCRQNNNKE